MTLDVNDANNKTVEHVEYVPRTGLTSAFQIDPPALKSLRTLYEVVKEQVTQGNATMRALAEEFNDPEPEG